jgi:hypothetical protein
MVLMAGTGVHGDEVLVAQAAAIVESMGAPQATVDQVTVRQRETLALVKTEADEYGDIEETMAPAVLDTIAKGVSQR